MGYAMGWLGWTEEQTLRTSIPSIELAYRARVDMLAAVGLLSKGDAPAPSKSMPVTADNLRMAFRVAGGYGK